MMDRLLDNRKVTVTEKEFLKSLEMLIAYINQSDYDRWIINNYAHLLYPDKRTFRKGINEVLPYIADRELFISHIKYSMKTDMCRNFAVSIRIEAANPRYCIYFITFQDLISQLKKLLQKTDLRQKSNGSADTSF